MGLGCGFGWVCVFGSVLGSAVGVQSRRGKGSFLASEPLAALVLPCPGPWW